VIIDHGKLKFVGSLDELGSGTVSVRAVQLDRLRAALSAAGYQVRPAAGALEVAGATAEDVGRVAAEGRIALSALTADGASLEAAFLRLTSSDEAPRASRFRRGATAPAPRASN
jgi:ABC-2 type transport system ATP-binding protein